MVSYTTLLIFCFSLLADVQELLFSLMPSHRGINARKKKNPLNYATVNEECGPKSPGKSIQCAFKGTIDAFSFFYSYKSKEIVVGCPSGKLFDASIPKEYKHENGN